jgi:hypothetical protein
MDKHPQTKIMKKLILASIVILLTAGLMAQPTGYHRVYHTYRGEKGVVAIYVPGFLMRFVGVCADLDPQERQLLRCMRSLTVLTIEEEHLYPDVNFVQEMDVQRMTGDYQLMMEVHDGDEEVIIAAREKRGYITDLIVVVGGSENVLVHVRGRMKADMLEELAGATGIDELKVTAKI